MCPALTSFNPRARTAPHARCELSARLLYLRCVLHRGLDSSCRLCSLLSRSRTLPERSGCRYGRRQEQNRRVWGGSCFALSCAIPVAVEGRGGFVAPSSKGRTEAK
eukprot:1843397-Rhodomonas_salina.1